MRAVGLLICAVAAGCTFSPPRTNDDGGVVPIDQPMPDAPSCFGQGFGQICLASPPTQGRTVQSTIDTSADTACDEIVRLNGIEVCAITGTSVDVAVTSLVRGVGSRPIVIVASGSISIAGTLDVGSQRGGRAGAGAQGETCAGLEAARGDDGGGGGGAGGSYFGAGGDGGTGDLNSNGLPPGVGLGGIHAPAFTPTAVRAGCRGGNGGNGGSGSTSGGGGRGGGALYMIAGAEIRISGRVMSYGAGGAGATVQGGAGGGGSGGLIGLDAPSVNISGFLAANGGGGGEGAGLDSGVSGEDGTIDASRAAGGIALMNDGGSNDGGNGGKGSGGTELSGDKGGDNNGGAGGGGGGAGLIYVKGTLTLTGLASPAPMQVPRS
ncbi:MAG TPA: hypothetical protein VNO30_34070 [Kofleriaceae bacterium]|nr:hypothetical protein [Kofleriaceae bacterium]